MRGGDLNRNLSVEGQRGMGMQRRLPSGALCSVVYHEQTLALKEAGYSWEASRLSRLPTWKLCPLHSADEGGSLLGRCLGTDDCGAEVQSPQNLRVSAQERSRGNYFEWDGRTDETALGEEKQSHARLQ